MKRVVVRNLEGVQTHGADLEDPTQWVSDQVTLNAWGKPDRWVRKEIEDVSKSTKTRTVKDPAGGPDITEYFLPATYTVDIQDITAEVTAEKTKFANRDKMKSRILEIIAKDTISAAEASEGFDLLARYVFLQDVKPGKAK